MTTPKIKNCIACGIGIHIRSTFCKDCNPRAQHLREDAVACPVCKKKYNLITLGHVKTHGFSCTLAFKKHFNLDNLQALSIRADHTKCMTENNPMSNVSHSSVSLEKMRANRSGKGIGIAGQYDRTPEIREKISKKVTANHLANKGNFTRGWLVESEKADTSFFVRSSWEERVIRILDLHPCVEDFQMEPFAILYHLNGRTRRYIPDFLVLLEGGIYEIWEVKPAWCLNNEMNTAKMKALNDYAKLHHMNGRIVDLPDILAMEQLVLWRADV